MRRTPMTRTGFARRTDGPRHIADILAQALPSRPLPRLHRVPAPSAPIFHQTPKQEYVRDEGYRRFVAAHACFRCGIAGISQAAHANSAEAGKGMSIKASDAALFPLCASTPGRAGCHDEHDQARDGLTRDERRAIEVEWIARMDAITALEGFQRKAAA